MPATLRPTDTVFDLFGKATQILMGMGNNRNFSMVLANGQSMGE